MITCEFENGHRTNLRHVTVGAIVENTAGEILLVKRASHLTNGGKYAIPGGFLDRDETTEGGTLRELEEETGYKGEIAYLFHIVDRPDRPKEDRQNVDFRYVVTLVGGEKKESDETSEVGWFSEQNLPSEDDFAFDHRKSVELFFRHKTQPLHLPIMNY